MKRLNTSIRFTAIGILALVLALNIAAAPPQKKNNNTETNTAQYYYASMVVQRTGGNGTDIARQGKSWVWMYSTFDNDSGAVDAYMDEQGIDSVEITAELIEEWIQPDNAEGYYRLSFTFGPSGCFFNPPLYVELAGKYVSNNSEVWMYDEYGEALDSTTYAAGKKIIFEVSHFSSYSYDHYDY